MNPQTDPKDIARSERNLYLFTLLGLAAGKTITAVGHRKERRSVRIFGRIVTGYSLLSAGALVPLGFVRLGELLDELVTEHEREEEAMLELGPRG